MSTTASGAPLQQVWAEMAYDLLRDTILHEDETGLKCPLPDRVIVSYGWIDGKDTRGACIHGPDTIKDKDAVIFIRPDDWGDAVTCLTVLVHEMIHAGLPLGDFQVTHTGEYARIATQVGLLEGGTEPTQEFLDVLAELATQLPEFPAAPLEGEETQPPQGGQVVVRRDGTPNPPPEPKKQKNRNRRYICDCGVKVRAFSDSFQALCTLCNTTFQHVPADSE